jgi:hypothetical protein
MFNYELHGLRWVGKPRFTERAKTVGSWALWVGSTRGANPMSLFKAIIFTSLLAFLIVKPVGIEQYLIESSSGQALAGNGIKIDVKIISNPNRTFSIEAPHLTEVDCSGGATDLIFELMGPPGASFPEDASTGIKFVTGTDEFETPNRNNDRRISVVDRCTQIGEFKYDIGVMDPNGQLVILDPLIKNN